MSTAHIFPADDLRPHVEAGEWCHCSPRVQNEGEDKILIHNAYDGREFYESRPLELNWMWADPVD